MIADLLAYLRDGWRIVDVVKWEGRDQWKLTGVDVNLGRRVFVRLPEGWVRSQ